jgi:nitroreductase
MLEAIKKRRSIRKFKKKDVEQEKLEEILRAAMYSPSAMHRRPWEFIVIRSQEMKDKISKATPSCDFVKNAPIVLIIAAKESPLWVENCSIAAEAVYLEAENQDLGTCFCQILGSKNNLKDGEDYIRETIKATKDIRILCIMPIGYPDEEKEEHNEKEFDKSKIRYEKY